MQTEAPTPEALAKRNTLACLAENHGAYRKAGNKPMADLFAAAFDCRLDLIAAGKVAVGTFQPVSLTPKQLAEADAAQVRA